jgi:hypothetical protein
MMFIWTGDSGPRRVSDPPARESRPVVTGEAYPSLTGVDNLYTTLRRPPVAVIRRRVCEPGSHTVSRRFPYLFAGDLDLLLVVIPDTAKKGQKREITVDRKC